MSDAAESARIRALRPPRSAVDPWRPFDVVLEDERGSEGSIESSMTVFLTGSECPFACVYCDLWQHTLEGPTPRGAIPRQLELAVESLRGMPPPDTIKLYNASNFFESRAVPPEDLEVIADRLAPFRKVVVECHPRLVGPSSLEFARLLAGDLEVAMGLETIHPTALPRLNKAMTLEDFESAVTLLQDANIGTRAFVLLSPPFVPVSEAVMWTIRTVEHALHRGIGVVSIIPSRTGRGEMERLAAAGLFEPPTLEMLERALAGSLALAGGVVLADLWDVESVRSCDRCREGRIGHLQEMNRTGLAGEVEHCARCSSATQGDE